MRTGPVANTGARPATIGNIVVNLQSKWGSTWETQSSDIADAILNGEDYRKLPRYAVIYADDPADAAAQLHNRELQLQHEAWLEKAVSGDR